jgi:hypothetical protein
VAIAYSEKREAAKKSTKKGNKWLLISVISPSKKRK